MNLCKFDNSLAISAGDEGVDSSLSPNPDNGIGLDCVGGGGGDRGNVKAGLLRSGDEALLSDGKLS